jgi:hypothetical protein
VEAAHRRSDGKAWRIVYQLKRHRACEHIAPRVVIRSLFVYGPRFARGTAYFMRSEHPVPKGASRTARTEASASLKGSFLGDRERRAPTTSSHVSRDPRRYSPICAYVQKRSRPNVSTLRPSVRIPALRRGASGGNSTNAASCSDYGSCRPISGS